MGGGARGELVHGQRVHTQDVDEGHVQQEEAVQVVERPPLVRSLDAQEHGKDGHQCLLEYVLEEEGSKVGHEEEEAEGKVQAGEVALVVMETSLERVQDDAHAHFGIQAGKEWEPEYPPLDPPHGVVQ